MTNKKEASKNEQDSTQTHKKEAKKQKEVLGCIFRLEEVEKKSRFTAL